jgi:L-iditol 2-dehydrogenase
VARLYAAGDIRFGDEPEPVPALDEELVRVEAVGVCGSDLHWFAEGGIGDAVLTRPLVLGHEMAGTIAAGPREGLRVAIDAAIPCWNCASCHRGWPNLCLDLAFAGHEPTDGGMREYLAWPARRLHPVPDGLDADTAALLEPLGVALHAYDLSHHRLATTVAVVGCGPIGLFAVQLAYAAGADTVLAVEPLPWRRELAARYGAEAVSPAEAAEGLAGIEPETVIEAAGNDAAVQQAIDLVRPGGRVVLAGIPDNDRTTFTASSARRKGLTIAMSRRMGEVYPRAIDLVASGRIDAAGIISHRYPMDEAAPAMRAAAARTGYKTVIRP